MPPNLPLTALLFAVAISSSACARMTRPTRNYYPMQRVLWSVLGFVYGGGALSSLFRAEGGSPVSRAVFTAAVLAATTYSVFFMRRRNRTPRFLPVGPTGAVEMVPVEDLRFEFDRMVSYLGHGAMPEAWVPELDRARARWQELEDGRDRLARQIIERKRRGID